MGLSDSITVEEVRRRLSKLERRKATGPERIAAAELREAIDDLAPVLFAGQRGLRLWRVDAGVNELADKPVALGEPRHAVEEEVVPVLPGSDAVWTGSRASPRPSRRVC